MSCLIFIVLNIRLAENWARIGCETVGSHDWNFVSALKVVLLVADERVNGDEEQGAQAEVLASGGADAKVMAAPVDEMAPEDVALMAAHPGGLPDPGMVPPVTVAGVAAGPGMSHGPPHHPQDYHSAGMSPAQHPMQTNMYIQSYGFAAPSVNMNYPIQYTYQVSEISKKLREAKLFGFKFPFLQMDAFVYFR